MVPPNGTGVAEKCRLLGIDTPELSYGSMIAGLDRLAAHTRADERAELEAAIAVVRRHAKSKELRARSARATLTRLLGERAVIMISDPTQPARDRYGRLLTYIELDGRDVVVDERFPCERLEEYLEILDAAQN